MSDQADFLRIEGLRKAFGGTVAVEDFSLDVPQGAFVSILGPSGCGKTTTLRMVAGFIAPDAGRILLNGARIDDRPTHLRDAAMVFQNYALFPHMTVFENVAFGLRMQKVAKPEIARRVQEALAMVRLPDLGQRLPRALSGGQQQRVALARAIVLKPKLLLLDEPLSNLDAKLRKELRAEFTEIHRLAQITTLFVTHDLEEAFSLSDRIAVMSQGRLEQYGTPVEIYTRPATAFVADFVGHANVLEGVLAADGGGLAMRAGGLSVQVACAGPAGRPVRLALPGHALRIGAAAAGAGNRFPARLERLAFLGQTIQFGVALGDIRFTGEMYATADALARREGETVEIGWDAADMIELPATGAGA